MAGAERKTYPDRFTTVSGRARPASSHAPVKIISGKHTRSTVFGFSLYDQKYS
jgi:hypothetical protein